MNWTPYSNENSRPFQEAWIFKASAPDQSKTLLVRHTVLISRNGFHRKADIDAFWFEEGNCKHFRESFELEQLSRSDGLSLPGITLNPSESKGRIKSIEWELKLDCRHPLGFDFNPELLERSGVVPNKVATLCEALTAHGSLEIEGKKVEVKGWTAYAGHEGGKTHGHTWSWAQASEFRDTNGSSVDFIFDGLTGRSKLFGKVPSPLLTSFFFYYRGKRYDFNGALDTIRSRSKVELGKWTFQADRGDLSFKGELVASPREFAGYEFEDTDGTLLYGAFHPFGQVTIQIERRGKLETALTSPACSFEHVERRKNPYIQQWV